MAQRPSFDMSKLSTPDKIVLGGAALFVIDSFLPWQRVCTGDIGDFPGFCVSANLWEGSASFTGVLAGLLAILVLVAGIIVLAGVAMPVTLPASTVVAWLAFGTALFGVLKFAFVLTNEVAYGAFIGLILALALAYGGWMKMQEPATIPPPAASGPEPGQYNP